MPVLAIDAGTTGVTALVVGEDGGVLSRGYREFAQLFPRPGWVEHEPDDIWTATVAAWDVVRDAFGKHDAPSTLVGVTVLGYPDQLVEVEAVAVLDSWREPAPPHEQANEDA